MWSIYLHLASNLNKQNFEVQTIIHEGKRRRYIGFIIKSNKPFNITKEDVISELRKQCKSLFKKDCRELGVYLIKFNNYKGIVRCKHTEKDNTINLLKSIKSISSNKLDIETLGTSGTIKSLIKKHMADFQIQIK